MSLPDHGYLQPQNHRLGSHDTESGELAKQLLEPALLRESCWHQPPVLHSDNGVADDVPYAQSEINRTGDVDFFQSTESRQRQPLLGIAVPYRQILSGMGQQGLCIASAVWEWMLTFERAYNAQHLHSGIYVTPADRHRGVDRKCLERRKAVYESANRRYPKRWSGRTRNWEVIGSLSLNPGKVHEIERNKQAA